MEGMKFESAFTTAIVSKLVQLVIRNKLGYSVDVGLNKFRTTVLDGKTHVHLDVDFEVSNEEFNKIMSNL